MTTMTLTTVMTRRTAIRPRSGACTRGSPCSATGSHRSECCECPEADVGARGAETGPLEDREFTTQVRIGLDRKGEERGDTLLTEFKTPYKKKDSLEISKSIGNLENFIFLSP